MRAGVIIFIILVCAVVLVEIISLIKTLSDKRKAKKQEKEKQKKSIDTLSSWEDEYNKKEAKNSDTSSETCASEYDNKVDP